MIAPFATHITRALFGLVLSIGITTQTPALAGVTLTGDTSRPNDSTFRLGEPVVLAFTVSGLAPDTTETVAVTIKDEHDAVVDRLNAPLRADAAGNATAKVDAPGGRLGFYRVFASLSDGTTLPARFTRPAGCLTYAVVPDPAQRIDYGQAESLFGMQGAFGSNTVRAIPLLGVRWVLGGNSWYWAEPHHAGEYKANPKRMDVYTKGLGDSWRLSRVFIVEGAPEWAGVRETRASSSSRTAELTPEGETAYMAYCKEVARDVAPKFPDEPKHFYQPLWEPVTPWGYKGTDAALVRICQIAYESIHSIDPKAVMIGPCGSSMDQAQIAWNERLLRAGVGKYIDAISIHPYVQHPAEEHGYVDNVRAFKAMIRRETGKDLAIMGTEQGITTNEDIAKELDQAQGMIRQNLMTLGEGFACNYAFYFSDYHMGSEKGYGMYYNLDPGKNWGSDFASPKPVAPAYAAMTLLLDGHQSNGPLDGLKGSSLGYAFQRGAEIVAAVWDYSKGGRQISLPVGGAKIEAFDWMGRALPIAPKDGAIILTLGSEPVYLRGLPPALYGKPGERGLALSNNRVEALPGTPVELAGKVRAAGRVAFRVNIDGQSEIVLPASAVRGGNFRVSVPILSRAKSGERHVLVTALRGGELVGIAEATIDIKPVIEAGGVRASFQDRAPVVVVSLSSNSRHPEKAIVRVSVNEAPAIIGEATATMAAGARADVTVPLPGFAPDAVKRYHIRATVDVPDASETECNGRVGYLFVPRAAKPPSIGGDMIGIGEAPSIHIGRQNVIRSAAYLAGDLSADLRYAWDDHALYFACRVSSPTQIQPFRGADIWRGDCIQMAFNLDPSVTPVKTGNMAADVGSLRYTELNFALTADGPVCSRSLTFDPAKLPVGEVRTPDITLAIVRKEGATEYEAQIPWTTLGAAKAPDAGSSIGIAATINKIFAAGQPDPTALGLYDGIASSKDPTKFGSLLLLPGGR